MTACCTFSKIRIMIRMSSQLKHNCFNDYIVWTKSKSSSFVKFVTHRHMADFFFSSPESKSCLSISQSQSWHQALNEIDRNSSYFFHSPITSHVYDSSCLNYDIVIIIMIMLTLYDMIWYHFSQMNDNCKIVMNKEFWYFWYHGKPIYSFPFV